MTIIAAIASRHVANKTMHIDGCSNGRAVLHQCLQQLQQRLNNTEGEAAAHQASLMNYGVGDAFALAYQDFAKFSEKFSLTIHFWQHPEKSNNFTFHLVEKNECPRSWHYRFTGLRGAMH